MKPLCLRQGVLANRPVGPLYVSEIIPGESGFYEPPPAAPGFSKVPITRFADPSRLDDAGLALVEVWVRLAGRANHPIRTRPG